ncbi:hypothetical protein [Sphingobium phenoxybenzoativorans]|uniref:hypothetical protein n=1 Tax=Sphingobium phenoxybenzoativorans TaxID=1592790 RepID=UPI000872058B|nr:hypothetical protein [Sphingobium phenoxybenzoativorans]
MTISEFLPDRQLWSHRLSRWRALSALAEAEYHFGEWAKANDLWEREKQRIDRLPGLTQPARRLMLEHADAAMNEAEKAKLEAFDEPAEMAAIEVVLTPSPDLDGIPIKVELIEKYELNNTTLMTRNVMEVLLEDFRRLEDDA